MQHAYRHSHVVPPAFVRLPAGALKLDDLSSPLLGLALAVWIGLAALTAERMIRVDRDLRPALESARELGSTLEATRLLLGDARLPAAARISQADHEASRFHGVATATHTAERTRMLGYDASFGDYYVAARRAAEGLSMSAEADGSSVEEASLSLAIVRERLAVGTEAQRREVAAANRASAPAELGLWLALAAGTTALLVRRALRWRPATPAADRSPGARYAPVPARDGPGAISLQDAVQRMARRRLAASVAAAKVARRNNERQIELARSWNVPMLTLVPATQPTGGMEVYADEPGDAPAYGGLALMMG